MDWSRGSLREVVGGVIGVDAASWLRRSSVARLEGRKSLRQEWKLWSIDDGGMT